MSQKALEFTSLFKVDSLLNLDILLYKFCEVGQKKITAIIASDGKVHLHYINGQLEKFQKSVDYIFKEIIDCLCFDSSACWIFALCKSDLYIIPCLPILEPNCDYDKKWSLTDVTKLEIETKMQPLCAAWWLTQNAENIIVIGQKNGIISFFSLDLNVVIAETSVPEPVLNVQISTDNSMDVIVLIISGQDDQYRLHLEDRSANYSWLQASQQKLSAPPPVQTSPPPIMPPPSLTREKSNFFSYIKQLSTDKIAIFSQKKSTSQESEEPPPVVQPSYPLEPVRKDMPTLKWSTTVQYVDGSHVITSLDRNCTMIVIEIIGEETPKHKLAPLVERNDYLEAVWSPKLVYLIKECQLEIHSSYYSSVPVTANSQTDRKSETIIWKTEFPSGILGVHLTSPKTVAQTSNGWKEPTFICDLNLPRFNLEPCIVVAKDGISLISTSCDPCEFLVRGIVGGGQGCEKGARALGAPLPPLLRAAADLTLARNSLVPATYLYHLSKSDAEGWMARLGVFGKMKEIAEYRPRRQDNSLDLSSTALFMQTLAGVEKNISNPAEKLELNLRNQKSVKELEELCLLASTIGLWDMLTLCSIHSGVPKLILKSFESRQTICRGALRCLLSNDLSALSLLEEDFEYFHQFLRDHVGCFDNMLLKYLARWICPLRAEFRPIFRDLKQGINSVYTQRYITLITTFTSLVSELDLRRKSLELDYKTDVEIESFKVRYVPKRVLSCGLNIWAYVDSGRIRTMNEDVILRTEVIGRVMDVACGNNHIVILSENGVYSCGANNLGQLGIGEIWPESCSAFMSPYPVKRVWKCAVVSVAAGNFHSACIDAKGSLYMWGWNVHGQLGLGNIYDQPIPRLVTALPKNMEVQQVACGSCHTTILLKNGEVWVTGCNIFGQLGTGDRIKHSVPIKVELNEPAVKITAGHFHSLALTKENRVYIWGASPQNVRATAARPPPKTNEPATQKSESKPTESRTRKHSKIEPKRPYREVNRQNSKSPPPDSEPHLIPSLVDTDNVNGRIVQISAGWHHSVLLTDSGSIYSWGLNFEGQLGSGDRKVLVNPTEIKLNDSKDEFSKLRRQLYSDLGNGNAAICCGGDYTVYIDAQGKIFSTGLNPQEADGKRQEKVMLKMRNTGRMLPLPLKRDKNRFKYQPIGQIESSCEPDRETITPYKNPIERIKDFDKPKWSDEIIYLLKAWLNNDMFNNNKKLSAKLAYFNRNYSNCLADLLDYTKMSPKAHVPLYLKHTQADENEFAQKLRLEERNVAIANIIKKRLKRIGLALLNDQSIPDYEVEPYRNISCHCKETENAIIDVSEKCDISDSRINLAKDAASVLNNALVKFPENSWDSYIKLTRSFYAENDLPFDEMENVLTRFINKNARIMGDSVVLNDECSVFIDNFTPKFYLNLVNSMIELD